MQHLKIISICLLLLYHYKWHSKLYITVDIPHFILGFIFKNCWNISFIHYTKYICNTFMSQEEDYILYRLSFIIIDLHILCLLNDLWQIDKYILSTTLNLFNCNVGIILKLSLYHLYSR